MEEVAVAGRQEMLHQNHRRTDGYQQEQLTRPPFVVVLSILWGAGIQCKNALGHPDPRKQSSNTRHSSEPVPFHSSNYSCLRNQRQSRAAAVPALHSAVIGQPREHFRCKNLRPAGRRGPIRATVTLLRTRGTVSEHEFHN